MDVHPTYKIVVSKAIAHYEFGSIAHINNQQRKPKKVNIEGIKIRALSGTQGEWLNCVWSGAIGCDDNQTTIELITDRNGDCYSLVVNQRSHSSRISRKTRKEIRAEIEECIQHYLGRTDYSFIQLQIQN